MSGGTMSAINVVAAAGAALVDAPTRLLVFWIVIVAMFCSRDVALAQIRRHQAREVAALKRRKSD
jgi:hypothetical protein